jgi:alkylation response protein AidB-like acyl-CoA dehydrogenase
MRVVLTPEQVELRAVLRELFTDHCPTTLVRSMKESSGYPAQLWRVLAQSGLLGLAVDPEYGGEGASLVELGLLFEEAGRALCPTVFYSTCVFGVALQRLGSAEQRKDLLTALVAGELTGSHALWNPSDAGDLAPTLTASREGAGWRLSGTLMFVPNGELADVVLVSARDAEGRTLGFLLRDGGTRTPLTTIAGDKQTRITLDRQLIPDTDVLPEFDDDALRGVADAAVALQCMEMVGGATAVLEMTADYIKTREQFGRAIGSFQAAQHHIANMRIAVEASRLAAWHAIARTSAGVPAHRAVAVAKMQVSEAYKWNTLTAHQLHGGIGYVRETDLHLWSERAKVAEVQGGNADVAAGWLQRENGLLG